LEKIEAYGHDLQLVALGPWREDWPQRWPIHLLPPDFPGQPPKTIWRMVNLIRGHKWVPVGLWLWGALQMRHLLNRLKPDLVHVHYLDQAPISTLLTGFHPIVASAWGSDLLIKPDHYNAPQQWLFRQALRRADRLICNSDALKQAAVKMGVQPSQIHLRQWGVDLDHFHPQVDTADLRRKWEIPANARVLLSPRNFQKPLYCIEGILRAFCRVLEHDPSLILVQLGGSREGSQTELMKLAADLGIANQIRWAEFLSDAELPSVFALADLTLSLAISDSTPTSLLEAMACGSLPIFTDVGGVSEWIETGKNGLLVPPGDANGMAQAILEALARPQVWWDAARDENQRIIRSRANRAAEFSAVIADYESLIANSKKTQRVKFQRSQVEQI
jgi:glycosyltransferase involved in cell wall biosynthesis